MDEEQVELKGVQYRTLQEAEERSLPIYVNNAQIRMGPWDIEILFGQTVGIEESKLVVANRSKITMSPEHAKALHVVLGENLKKYEAQFGEIAWPGKVKQ